MSGANPNYLILHVMQHDMAYPFQKDVIGMAGLEKLGLHQQLEVVK